MDETNCRKCGLPCSRSMPIQGIGPVCITCFRDHKEKPFWENIHDKLDSKLNAKRRHPDQRSISYERW